MNHNNRPEIELDHIGIAAEAIGSANGFWAALGFSPQPALERVEGQKVDVAMLGLGNRVNIELLQPTSDTSPIAKFLEKRGPGIHHICLRVRDIVKTLDLLKQKGIRLINEEPVAGAHDCLVAFVHPSSTGGVLVELSQKKGKI